MHECPICKRVLDCLDPNCNGLRNELCKECTIIVSSLKVKKQMEDMIRKFNEDPKQFEQTLPSFKNTIPKGNRRTEIPNKSIPHLVRTIFTNSLRLRNDAEILFNAKSYESSIVRLFETTEELAKIIILLVHYRKQVNVLKAEVKQIFHNHRYRLQEFARFFYNSLAGETKEHEQEFNEWYFNYAGRYDQDVKEKLTYVDWVEDQIHNPLHFGEITEKGKDVVDHAHQVAFRIKAFEVDTVVNSLKNDLDFQRIMSENQD